MSNEVKQPKKVQCPSCFGNDDECGVCKGDGKVNAPEKAQPKAKVVESPKVEVAPEEDKEE